MRVKIYGLLLMLWVLSFSVIANAYEDGARAEDPPPPPPPGEIRR